MGNKVSIYTNRIEYKFAGKSSIIPIRNIANIDLPLFLACVDIKTNDGRKNKIPIAINKREEFKNDILNLL